MNACSNFQLSLTGGFQECRNCRREKKFHNQDFENKNIEYMQKSNNNNNASKFQQDKLQQIAKQKQEEEDELKAKACSNFVLALTGQFQQCGNCKIEKKYHKLDTAGQIAYQPKSQLTKSVQQTQQQSKPIAVAEVVQETMMVQSVKDRIAQMNKKNQSNNEPQFRSSIKKEEIQEKVPGQAEIVTEQVFTSVSDKKSVFDKQRIRKTIEQSSQQIREQQNVEGLRKIESQFITSQENSQQNQEQIINNENQFQDNQDQDSENNLQNQQQEQQQEFNQAQQQDQIDEQQQQQQQYQEQQYQQQELEQQEAYQQKEQQYEQQVVEHQQQQEVSNEYQQQNNQNEQDEQPQQQNNYQDQEQQDVQIPQESNNQEQNDDIY